MLYNYFLLSNMHAFIIKRKEAQKIKKKLKSPTRQRNSEEIPILIRDKGENQLKFKLLKLQVKD